MVEVINRQRGRKIELHQWTAFSREALEAIRRAEGEAALSDRLGATIAFVGDRTMRRLNRDFRGKNSVTDVLSFPSGEEEHEEADKPSSLGDVIISVPQAARQAAENGLTFEDEIAQLILHGLLHLCGYDHAVDVGEMKRLELRLRQRLGIG